MQKPTVSAAPGGTASVLLGCLLAPLLFAAIGWIGMLFS